MIHELRHLGSFLKVAQTRNLTRAAADLNLSQSALTVHIQQLESTLGVLLFDRNKRGVTLTTAGQDMLGRFTQLYEDAQSIITNAHDLSAVRRGSVTIVAIGTVSYDILPAVIVRFGRAYPSVRIEMLIAGAENVRDAVLRLEADIGFGTLHGRSDELIGTPLFYDRLVVFAPKSHALAGKRFVTLREAYEYNLILPAREISIRENIQEVAQREGITSEPRYEVNHTPTALFLVQSGLGIAILPDSTGSPESAGLVRIPLTKHPIIRTVQLIKRRDRSLSPAAKLFVDAFHAQLRERPNLNLQLPEPKKANSNRREAT